MELDKNCTLLGQISFPSYSDCVRWIVDSMKSPKLHDVMETTGRGVSNMFGSGGLY